MPFDRIKSLLGIRPNPWTEIRRTHRLERRQATHPMIAGSAAPTVWWGRHARTPFTTRNVGQLELIVGRLFPCIDFVLVSGTSGRPPRVAPLLPEVVGKVTPPSGMLADRYAMKQVGHEDARFLGLQLRDRRIASALNAMSPAVREVAFYRKGVELRLAPRDLAQFGSDLDAAVRIVVALDELHTDEESERGSLPVC